MQFKSQKSFNIILDLDQTIIAGESYTELNSIKDKKERDKLLQHLELFGEKYGKKIFKVSANEQYIIYGRPYLQEFLDALFANFNVSVWTAASSDYANFVIQNFILVPGTSRTLDFIYTRSHCEILSLNDGSEFLTKPLIKIFQKHKLYNQHNTFILDDNPDVHKIQKNNCILAKPFEIVNKEINSKGDIKYVKSINGEYIDYNGINDNYLVYILPKLWNLTKNK